jgi:hypothetical protein
MPTEADTNAIKIIKYQGFRINAARLSVANDLRCGRAPDALSGRCTPGAGCVQAVSKPQIAVKGKAQLDEKAKHIQTYVSILKRAATPPLGVRWGFETTCSEIVPMDKSAKYRIKVRGMVPERWHGRLGGLQIVTTDQEVVTLEGLMADQAALNGVLETLYQLRLPILEVVSLQDH